VVTDHEFSTRSEVCASDVEGVANGALDLSPIATEKSWTTGGLMGSIGLLV
jgi:hypothetical protein